MAQWKFGRRSIDMPEQKKQSGLWLAVVVSAAILAAIVIWRVAIFKPNPRIPTRYQHVHLPPELPVVNTNDVNQPKIPLDDLIDRATYWQPVYTSSYGKMTPDFTLTDIKGKQHRLSDYRGKDVILIFWATWCGYCKMHTPHLIALRNIIGEDKLAMLAISYVSVDNTPAMIRSSVAQNTRINYPNFASDRSTIPSPYDAVMRLPCTFFIRPDGRIKLATLGFVPLGEMKAILRAD